MKSAMKISLVLLTALFFAVPPVRAENSEGQTEKPERTLKKEIREQGEKEDACECCLNCRAATKTIRGKEEGHSLKDGCKDCCERCGEIDLPLDPKTPPDMRKNMRK